MTKKIKNIINFIAAFPLCRWPIFRKYKLFLLSAWTRPALRKGLDRICYRMVLSFWIQNEYLSERDPDKREQIKVLVMGKEGGRAWAEHYDSLPIDLNASVGNLKYFEARPLLPQLDQYLSAQSGSVVVVQVGSSSGKELGWLAQRNPRHTYIGTDIYPEVIEYSAKSYPYPNLQFTICAAKDIYGLVRKFLDKKVIIISSGSLQYVQPEHIVIFFESLKKVADLEIILLEPTIDGNGNPDQFTKSSWRSNLAYAHPYRHCAEQAGFKTKLSQTIRPFLPYENFPVHKNTAHYYYWAVASPGADQNKFNVNFENGSLNLIKK